MKKNDKKTSVFPPDNRKCDRLPLTAHITYQTEDGNKKNGTVLSTNVSGWGLSFSLDEKLPKGTPLKLTITLPEIASPIHATGNIVWCKEITTPTHSNEPFEVGIQLAEIKEKDAYFEYICEKLLVNLIDESGNIRF